MAEHNISVEGGKSIRLKTAGKYCDRDIVVTATGGTEDLNAVLSEQEALIATLQNTLRTKTGANLPLTKKDINFYDYDGTLLHSYTMEEAQELTELPPLPEHQGLICQEWNYSLESIKSQEHKVDVGATYTTDDGTTRVYIHLEEGRTSPMLGVCPKGTVTVDWGDGTMPDVLTGTSTSTVVWTPTHEYAEPGDYVITLTVEGEMGLSGSSTVLGYANILRYSENDDVRNSVYQNAVQKIEIGSDITSIDSYAFSGCHSLASVMIPDGIKNIKQGAFKECYSLASIVIPNSVTSIGESVFYQCPSLTFIVIPNGVTSIGKYMFYCCHSLTSVVIPDGVKSIGTYAFYECYPLTSIIIPNGVTSIGTYAFSNCYSLTSITIPNGVTSIGAYTFYKCGGVLYYDFSSHTAVPTLAKTTAFTQIAADCEIRVPAALYDEWIAATNWSTYASNIVAV